MAEHNPYAVPKAPVADDSTADNAFAHGAGDVEYGGFWRRVAAQILDALILAPVSILAVFGVNLTHKFYIYYLLPGILIPLFYSVYLVKRYGGTPGKRIMNLRIVMTDGSPVTGTAALLRYSVLLVLSALSSIGLAMASTDIDADSYAGLGFLDKMQMLTANAPSWYEAATYGIQGWMVLLIVVMLCNERRRATHDFIAKTVVIRT